MILTIISSVSELVVKISQLFESSKILVTVLSLVSSGCMVGYWFCAVRIISCGLRILQWFGPGSTELLIMTSVYY